MQVKNRYDLIVVGDQLSGYFLAAGAAQAGFSVLVVEGSATPQAIYEVPSGKFLDDLSWEPFFGLNEDGHVDKFLRSLGLYEKAEELFPLFNPSVQILAGNSRVNYSYSMESMQREWRREFPAWGAGLARLAQESFNPHFKAETHPLAELIEQVGLPVSAEKLGQVQIALCSSLLPKNALCSSYRLSLQRSMAGIRYIMGGKGSVKERLVSRLQVHGGAIKRGAWAEEIVFEKGQLAGVLLSSFEGFVRSQQVVGAMASKRFLDLVPAPLRPKNVVEEVNTLRPKFWRLSFCLRVPEECVPEAMAQHLAHFDWQEDLQEENFIQLCNFPKGVYSGIGLGERALLLRVLIPYEEKSLDSRYISGVLKRAIKRLRTFMPFLPETGLQVSPDPWRLEEDPVYKRYFQFSDLRHIPPSMLVYDQINDPACERGVTMDWGKQGLTGMGFCSRDVNPLYGFYGEMLAAKEFLDLLIAKREAKKLNPAIQPSPQAQA